MLSRVWASLRHNLRYRAQPVSQLVCNLLVLQCHFPLLDYSFFDCSCKLFWCFRSKWFLFQTAA
ncbi:hypothetical protein HCBG_04218 [Histoplasma capsulatum G186AR]|uniref:Uncharacterized protein n=1 Tax=Ajellomyces capsulatus (strain G186AR / H82 / ATCC MYA-2454 / RMSCC 2432) TaxID=447093 RepID=C0NN91_AJECG|nr:uncharacterized protein HCBG_04218 [Histoplasma capsulatum G186AR]EEH07339.1 hypothetical protein HCBG_04218 [Histoplasma capsulatum G186AR]